VAKDSQIETFAALRLHIDTWRWAGVPFYIRAGKCLPISATEVMITLKRPPLPIFDPGHSMPPNYFRLRLSPEVVICAGALVKVNGEEMRGEPVELTARHKSRREKAPYERLLGDAVRGDAALFTQDASVEAAWKVIDPVLTAGPAVIEYAPGTWGPKAATDLVNGSEIWHDPQPEKGPPC
jgi:glucose-6-phosphate 1-dehydrogenase